MRLDYPLKLGTHLTRKRVNPLATAPTVVTVDEFKLWAKIDDTSEDSIIQSIVINAIETAESYTRRTINQNDYTTLLSGFASVEFTVHPIDLSTIAVTYYDVDNVQQTLDPALYYVIDNGPDAYVQLVFNGELPALYIRGDAVQIDFTAGYGTACPEGIRIGILKRAASNYENRQDAASIPGIIGKYALIAQYSHSDWFPYRML